jgi:hypothetical protein
VAEVLPNELPYLARLIEESEIGWPLIEGDGAVGAVANARAAPLEVTWSSASIVRRH